MIRRLAPVAAAAALALALAPAFPAAAAVVTTVGHSTAPAQPYLGNPNATDWLGGYALDFDQVFSVRFGLLSPDNDEASSPVTDLTTKWGTALAPDVSLRIAYLLWRYGDTTSADTAAALAHLLHNWTSGPQNPTQLDPSNDFRHIAYDAPFHLAKLPAGAQAAVTALEQESALYADAWVSSLLAPADPQVGVPGTWTLGLRTDVSATPIPAAPIRLEVTGGTFPGGVTTLDIVTGPAGEPVEVEVTPTAGNVEVTMTFDQPATTARMMPAVDVDTAAWVRRSDNVVSVSVTVPVVAAPAVVTPSGPTLPATGVPVSGGALAAGAALLVAGLALVAASRRGARV